MLASLVVAAFLLTGYILVSLFAVIRLGVKRRRMVRLLSKG